MNMQSCNHVTSVGQVQLFNSRSTTAPYAQVDIAAAVRPKLNIFMCSERNMEHAAADRRALLNVLAKASNIKKILYFLFVVIFALFFCQSLLGGCSRIINRTDHFTTTAVKQGLQTDNKLELCPFPPPKLSESLFLVRLP